MTWRGLARDVIERNFNARLAVPDWQASIERCHAETVALGARLAPERDVAYGKGPLETLDWYRAKAPAAPVHVFVHGGYWRAHDKDEFGFVAAPLVAAGFHVAVVNYPLCPAVTVPEVVGAVTAAVAWVAHHAEAFGGDAGRLTLSGHSVGAHLAAMAVAHNWTGEGLAANPVRRAALISGLYDLAPVLDVSVNAAEIRLTVDMVAPLSPIHFPERFRVPLLIAAGGAEAPLWREQSTDFADAVSGAGGRAEYLDVAGANHYTIAEGLRDAQRPLARALLRFLSAT